MNKILITIVALSILGACKNDSKVNQKMAENSEAMEEHCVGRQTITLPTIYAASPVSTGIFKFPGGSDQDPHFDVMIRGENISIDKFNREIMRRRAELKSAGDDTTNILRSERLLTDGAVIFRVQEIDDAYISEIFFLRGNSIVTVRMNSYDNRFADAEDKLINFSTKVMPRAANKPSTAREAFCLGSIEVHGDFEKEIGSYSFKNKDGAYFEVEIDTYIRDDSTSLLQRMSSSNSLLKVFDVNHKVIRAGERTVAGMRAQEWLGSAKLDERTEAQTLKFALETLRQSPGRSRPSISLTYNAVVSANPDATSGSLTSNDAVQTWDAVVSSIR